MKTTFTLTATGNLTPHDITTILETVKQQLRQGRTHNPILTTPTGQHIGSWILATPHPPNYRPTFIQPDPNGHQRLQQLEDEDRHYRNKKRQQRQAQASNIK